MRNLSLHTDISITRTLTYCSITHFICNNPILCHGIKEDLSSTEIFANSQRCLANVSLTHL
jgi:hypothetical protein